MYIVYSMIIYHVLIKLFSFNSGVMLSSSFSDELLLENVCDQIKYESAIG